MTSDTNRTLAYPQTNTGLVNSAQMSFSCGLPLDHDVADRVLHPGIGGQDERRRQHRAERHRPDRQQVDPARQLVPAEQPQPQERRLQEERGQPLHRQRRAENVADQPRVRAPVHPELELLHDPGHHADRHVDDQQRAEEPGQPQVLITLAAIPRRLQQRGQESQTDRDRDEEEMVDRHKGELHPRQVDVGHLHPLVRRAASRLASAYTASSRRVRSRLYRARRRRSARRRRRRSRRTWLAPT